MFQKTGNKLNSGTSQKIVLSKQALDDNMEKIELLNVMVQNPNNSVSRIRDLQKKHLIIQAQKQLEDEVLTTEEKDNKDMIKDDLIVFSTSPVVTESDAKASRKKNYDVKMSETLKNKIKYLNDNSLGG